jgi:hypothetical protein
MAILVLFLINIILTPMPLSIPSSGQGSLGFPVVGARCGGVFRAEPEKHPHLSPVSQRFLETPGQALGSEFTTKSLPYFNYSCVSWKQEPGGVFHIIADHETIGPRKRERSERHETVLQRSQASAILAKENGL